MDRGARSILPRDQRSRDLCGGGCPASVCQGRDLRGRRGRDGGEARSSIPWPPMNLNRTELQRLRATPLFSRLTDAQLGCLEPGEIIEAPVGTVLASEGERTGFFYVLLEGEV